MNHLESIAKAQEEVPELGSDSLEHEIHGEVMDLETILHNFRRSEVVEFLRQENQDKFGVVWKRLENIIYRVQRLLPDIDAMVGPFYEAEQFDTEVDRNVLPVNYNDITWDDVKIVGDLRCLKVILKDLVGTFQKDGVWHEVNFNSIGSKFELIYDFFQPHITEHAIKEGLLTTQQWRELSDREYVQVEKIDINQRIANAEHFLIDWCVQGLETRIPSIEEKLGMALPSNFDR